MKNFIVAAFFLFFTAFKIHAYDCLTVAYYYNNNELINFYTFIAAAYNQMNTNLPNGEDKYNLLEINTDYIRGSEELSKEFLSVLNTLVPKEFKANELADALYVIRIFQNTLKEYGLLNAAGIQNIHNASTYGDENGPILCQNGKILNIDELIGHIKNYSSYENKIKNDPRFKQLEALNENLPDTDPRLRIGAEFELFATKYIKLFEQFINSFQLLSSSKLSIDPNNFLSLADNVKKNTETMNLGEVLNKLKKVYDAPNDTVTNLEKIYANSLPEDLKWLLLAKQIRNLSGYKPLVFIKEIFPLLSMALVNFSVILDFTGMLKLYGQEIPKIEFAHNRPYKNARAYLESIILLLSEDKQLLNMILYPQKQLDNDYTHHVHISYQYKDLSDIGTFMQDLIALSMLTDKNHENIFVTKNIHIKYLDYLWSNHKGLVRIAVENDNSRIELRRQVSGWNYNKFINELYKLITGDNNKAIDDLKAMNRAKLNELKILENEKDISIGSGSVTAGALKHLQKQNE